MKEAARRTLRPAWERVWTRIEARVAPIEARTGVSENRLDRLEVQLNRLEAGWNQHTPAFLNAVSSVRAFARHLERAERGQSELWEANERAERGQSELWEANERAERGQSELWEAIERAERGQSELGEAIARTEISLWDAVRRAQEGLDQVSQRLEFVRTEVLNELRYGSESARAQAGEAHVVAPTKLEEALAQDELYLNLGCGHVPMEGYINVDSRDLPGVDVVADIAKLPFDEASVAVIHSSHVVEHFPQEMLIRRLLPHWALLLKDGGRFSAITPDGEAMLAAAAAGTMSYADYRTVLYGGQEYDGDFHLNMLTPDSMSELLREAGFEDVVVVDRGRPNGMCLEFEIAAVRKSRRG